MGAIELLYAAGFRQEKLKNNGAEEDFWEWNGEVAAEIQTLKVSI